MAARALRLDTTDDTSLRLTLIQRTGFKTSILRMRHRMAGFHKMASNTARAADGVMRS